MWLFPCLLHLRPLQYWLKPRVPSHAWHHGRLGIKVNQACVVDLAPWKNHQWMERGVPLGKLNLGADMLSRRNVFSDEWTLHPQTVQEIWGIFGRPEVDLFTSEDNTHCQTYFSPYLAQPPPLYFSPIALIPQVIRRIREQKHRVMLVAPL